MNAITVHIKRLDLNALVTLYDPDRNQRFVRTFRRDIRKDDKQIISMENSFKRILREVAE